MMLSGRKKSRPSSLQRIRRLPRKSLKILRLLGMLLRFILLFRSIRVWKRLKSIVSLESLKNLERRYLMTTRKAKILEDESEDRIPPMPGSGSEAASVSPSIGSDELPAPGADAEVVSPELAADLIDIPYQAWAVFEPEDVHEMIVLSERQKAFLGGPASRVLTKYGLGRIAKDEIILISGLSLHTIGAIMAVRRYKLKAIPPVKPLEGDGKTPVVDIP